MATLSPSARGATVYKAGLLKRRRRTRAEVDQLDEQILAVLREDQPQSVRHVFYRMTDPRLPEPVEKTEQGYNQVQMRITKLRRSGRLPYDWISDATRRGYYVPTFDGEADFLRRVARSYRADVWRDSAAYCEVWCESRSIAGVIQADCERLAVPLYPSGGFTSMTLAFQAAEYIRRAAGGRPAVIFYIGDYDQAGVQIDKDIERKLASHLCGAVTIDFRRIGINVEQIPLYGLPTKPRKVSDKRSPEVKATVEAEAMPAHILRMLLIDEIEALLPPDAVRAAQIEEQSARAYFSELAHLTDIGRRG